MKSLLAPMIIGMAALMSSVAYAGDDSANGVYQSGLTQDQQSGSGETIIEDVYDSITEYENVTENPRVIGFPNNVRFYFYGFGVFCGIERYENGVFKELVTCEGDIGSKGRLMCPYSYKKIETMPGVHVCKKVACDPSSEAFVESNKEYCHLNISETGEEYKGNPFLFRYSCEDIGLVTDKNIPSNYNSTNCVRW